MKTTYSILIIIILAVGIFFLARGAQKDSPQQIDTNTMSEQNNQEQTNSNDNVEAQSMDQLMMTTVKEGEGEGAKEGDVVSVNYTGYLADGTKFDSSLDRGVPFQFTLGAGQVIKGWDMGVLGMKVGEVRRLIIPADYAYGSSGVPGAIPADATLAFEVEMLEINPTE